MIEILIKEFKKMDFSQKMIISYLLRKKILSSRSPVIFGNRIKNDVGNKIRDALLDLMKLSNPTLVNKIKKEFE